MSASFLRATMSEDAFSLPEGSVVYSDEQSPLRSEEGIPPKPQKRVSLAYDGASTISERTEAAATDSSDDDLTDDFPELPDELGETQPVVMSPLDSTGVPGGASPGQRSVLSPIGNATSTRSRSILTLNDHQPASPGDQQQSPLPSVLRPTQKHGKGASKKVVAKSKINTHNQRNVKKTLVTIQEDSSPPRTPQEEGTAMLASSLLSNHMKMRRLQEVMKNEITPHIPKYLQQKADLDMKLKDQSLGKNVDLVGDEVWAQRQRWYQNPTYVAVQGWHPAEASSGALIEQSKSLKLNRLKTPADKRRVANYSRQANKNVEQMRESTAEVSQAPFRTLVFFDKSSKKNAKDSAESSVVQRGSKRANTTLTYYPPLNASEMDSGAAIDYKVPKALLSSDDAYRLGVTLGTTRIKLPGTTSGKKSKTFNNSSTVNGTSSLNASTVSSPMKFAKTTATDGSILPAEVYSSPSQLLKKGRQHKCSPNCTNCEDVSKDINNFEYIEEQREEERREQLELEAAKEEKEKEEAALELTLRRRASEWGDDAPPVARNAPLSDGAASVVVKALERMKTRKASFTRKPEKKKKEKENIDRHVTIAHLYFDMSHRDREDVYISVAGGLSFDLTRSKFASLMGHVLAPRIGVNLTDEQVHIMFSLFDVNHGGTISYFEYLTALCHTLLSDEQTDFLTGIFNMSIAARQQAALQKQIASGRSVLPASQMPSIGLAGPSNPPSAARKSQMMSKGPVLHSSIPGAGSALVRRPSLTASSFRRHTRSAQLDESSSDTQSKSFRGRRPSSRGDQDDDDLDGSIHKKARKSTVGGRHQEDRDDTTPVSGSGAAGRGDGQIVTLRKKHLQYDQLRHTVFAYRGHSLMFPHPLEDRFSQLVADCFDDLRDGDEVDVSTFKLLLFCDDAVMDTISEIFPKPVPFGLGHLVEGSDRVVAAPPGSLHGDESAGSFHNK